MTRIFLDELISATLLSSLFLAAEWKHWPWLKKSIKIEGINLKNKVLVKEVTLLWHFELGGLVDHYCSAY